MAHESPHHHHQEKHHGTMISAGLGYPDFLITSNATLQGFDSNHELYNLQAGMEMLGIPSKPQQNSIESWRGFFPRGGNSSGTSAYSQTSNSNDSLMVAPEQTSMNISWQSSNKMIVDDSSLRCLFPPDGDQQHSHGLSLSLCNPESSNAAFNPSFHHNLSPIQTIYQEPRQMRSSKYLIPARELLNEFCCLGGNSGPSKRNQPKPKQWGEGGSSSSSSSLNPSLNSLDILELQKRKSKLYSMLEEVDRRYRRYCEQMKVVVSSFEAVAGEGSAAVYSALASKTMSRHFRCLRDGIVGQIQAAKKAMGEKDPVAPGSTRGETPRLKLLDQCLRQQKAFQQGGLESHPWRPQRGLPERSVSILRAWLFEHFLHPYPSDVDKHILARQTGLSRSQVSNWFINARVRLWKPMVEEMYLEETKEQDNHSSHKTTIHEDNSYNNTSRPGQLESNQNPNPNPNSSKLHAVEHKPTPADLLHESGSLSSIINSSHHHSSLRDAISSKASEHGARHYQQTPRSTDNFGVVDMDFASYNQCSNQNFGGGSGGVSLTLGLQQHNGGSMNLSFSPATQNSLFFSGEPIEENPSAQFSIIDGEAQNLPYRNLMGAQLLHDLAG
ncbi:homeobox protein BEL1 homolog [Typha latifolia]|uniref:homeobox protein BEL1 homolog n=1 Tax=Typha latifolia TaxID=4733 RepID=UPI003C2FB8F2